MATYNGIELVESTFRPTTAFGKYVDKRNYWDYPVEYYKNLDGSITLSYLIDEVINKFNEDCDWYLTSKPTSKDWFMFMEGFIDLTSLMKNSFDFYIVEYDREGFLYSYKLEGFQSVNKDHLWNNYKLDYD